MIEQLPSRLELGMIDSESEVAELGVFFLQRVSDMPLGNCVCALY